MSGQFPPELQSWFIPYLNGCVVNDLCKDKATNVNRVLVNGQVKGQDGVNHRDCDHRDEKMKTVIYHAHGM